MKKNNFKSLMQAAVLICTPLAIASCDDVFGDVDNPVSSHISIKDAAVNLVLHADSTAKATYTRTAIAASGAQIEYSSSDEKIATVDAKTGKITAVGGGECEIIAKATGLDSRGNKTYQEEEVRFPVKVTDYRARIALKEGAEIPVYNSASATLEPIKLKEFLDVWPALGTKLADNTQLTVSYKPVSDPNGVIKSMSATGEITLKANTPGVAKIYVEIKAGDVPTGYEQKSFSKKQKTADFTIEVKEGVAYISGYDAEGEPEITYIYKDYNGQSYTKLSDVLTGTADVALAAGTYYLDQDIDFAHNIRIKGDVNIILGRGCDLNLTDGATTPTQFSFLDESASKTYKLNILTEPDDEDTSTPAVPAGSLSALRIKDFKEVNLSGGAWVYAPVDAVENVTINRGGIPYDLTGTGNVNVTEGFASTWGYGTANKLKGFATVTLAKAKTSNSAGVGNLEAVTSAIIAENTYAGTVKGVTTLTINKNASVGNIGDAGAANKVTNLTISQASSIGNLDNVGTAIITKTPTKGLNNITDLTLNDLNAAATGSLTLIGTVTINKLAAAKYFPTIQANAVNIVDGTITADKIVGWKNTTSTTSGTAPQATTLTISGGSLTVNNAAPATGEDYAIFGDVTMTGGALSVTGPTGGDNYAIKGNVSVADGLATDKFHAESVYHAVSGTITGTFEGSNGGATPTWTAVSGTDKPKWLRNKKAE